MQSTCRDLLCRDIQGSDSEAFKHWTTPLSRGGVVDDRERAGKRAYLPDRRRIAFDRGPGGYPEGVGASLHRSHAGSIGHRNQALRIRGCGALGPHQAVGRQRRCHQQCRQLEPRPAARALQRHRSSGVSARARRPCCVWPCWGWPWASGCGSTRRHSTGWSLWGFMKAQALLAATARDTPDLLLFDCPTVHTDQVRELGRLLVQSGAPRPSWSTILPAAAPWSAWRRGTSSLNAPLWTSWISAAGAWPYTRMLRGSSSATRSQRMAWTFRSPSPGGASPTVSSPASPHSPPP